MPRVVVLGCGTGVGKSRLSAALLRGLAARGAPCLGLKPVESGIAASPELASSAVPLPPPGSDARLLRDAGSVRPAIVHPLFSLTLPVSPHLAARAEGVAIDLTSIVNWVNRGETMALSAGPHRALWSVIETAGGVLSPLAPGITNFDLARALDPAIWVLVAADSLGVLHDASAVLEVLEARARPVDHVVLSQAREPDASTGTNAAELVHLGITPVSAVLARNDDHSLSAWVDRLLATAGMP